MNPTHRARRVLRGALLSALPMTVAGCPLILTLLPQDFPPTLTLQYPAESTEVPEGTPVQLVAFVADDNPLDSLTIRWVSSIQGLLAEQTVPVDGVARLAIELTHGEHRLTVTATDAVGRDVFVKRTLLVTDLPDAPTIEIVRPAVNALTYDNRVVDIAVITGDDLDGPKELLVAIESSKDGPLCTPVLDRDGQGQCSVSLSPGLHDLTATVTDREGLVGTSVVPLEVQSQTVFDDDGDGMTEDNGDCDDNNARVFLGNPEVCDGLDNDCDHPLGGFATPDMIDEGTPCFDDDLDGQSEVDGDCDDGNPNRFSGNGEIWYNGVDNDCLGGDDHDRDGDGYDGSSAGYPDCNDLNNVIHPGAVEICNRIDDDCSGYADEGLSLQYYYDRDGDGWAGDEPGPFACLPPTQPARPAGSTLGPTWIPGPPLDCNDSNLDVFPGAPDWHTDQHQRQMGGRTVWSYDWNCDDNEEVYETSSASWYCVWDNSGDLDYSISSGSGWSREGRPGCGEVGIWYTGRDVEFTSVLHLDVESCDPKTSERIVQTCR